MPKNKPPPTDRAGIPGPKPGPNPRTAERIAYRVTAGEYADAVAAAERERLSLGAFARECLLEAIAGQRGTQRLAAGKRARS